MAQLWGIDTRKQAAGPEGRGIANEGGSSPRNVGSANIIPKSGGIESLGDSGDMNSSQMARSSASGKTKKKWSPADWEEAMQALFTRLNKGLDFNDPRVQSILNNARNTTMQSANDRGIYGGYSEGQAEGSYIKAAAGLQDAQDARALQALGMGSGFSRGLANDAYGRAMDAYGKGEEEAGGWGAGIGGGLGALGGGILGFATGGPAGAIAGAKGGWDFGSKVGGGIGKLGYDSSNPKPTYGGY